ncbi:MAG: carboxypeptidase [Acidobacteria bacterium]|nr:MAG: carboxypeptidase [Acidobacteriota bacterium]
MSLAAAALTVAVAYGVSPGPAAVAADEAWAAPLPPALPWDGASRSLVRPPGDPWLTPAEASGFAESAGLDGARAFLARLDAASPDLRVLPLAHSAGGRRLDVVLATRGLADGGLEALPPGRPVVLVQAGIHAGEIDGLDAGLMLLRDLVPDHGADDLLSRVTLVFVPALNVDGLARPSRWGRINQRGPRHAGWRTNDRNLNLNRDYTKLDTPEVRAVVGLLDALDPLLYLDLHVTDGADYRYDITFGWNGPHGWSPGTARWLDAVLRPAVSADLERAGHVPGPLIFAADRLDIRRGVVAWTASPRLSNGYGDARHVPTILVENHSLKPFGQRVLGTRVLLESVLRLVADRGAGLAAARDADRALRRSPLPLGFARRDEPAGTMRFLGVAQRIELSAITGAPVARWTGKPWDGEVPVVAIDVPRPVAERPSAYWIPPAWTEAIERIRLHGIRHEVVDAERQLDAQVARLEDARLDGEVYEGRVRVRAGVTWTARRVVLPAGTVRVPTDQPLGDLAMLLLEPESPDSLFAWGFFPGVLQRTEYAEAYVMEPLAARMLAADPALADEFRHRLATDPEFRGSPRARLEFFYRRTPYWDERYMVYPVVRTMPSRTPEAGPGLR